MKWQSAKDWVSLYAMCKVRIADRAAGRKQKANSKQLIVYTANQAVDYILVWERCGKSR